MEGKATANNVDVRLSVIRSLPGVLPEGRSGRIPCQFAVMCALVMRDFRGDPLR